MPAFMEGRDRIEYFISLYNKRAVDIRACAQVINDNHPNCPLLVRNLMRASVVSFFSFILVIDYKDAYRKIKFSILFLSSVVYTYFIFSHK